MRKKNKKQNQAKTDESSSWKNYFSHQSGAGNKGNSRKKLIQHRHHSEDVLFGFLIAFSMLFALLCYLSVGNADLSSPVPIKTVVKSPLKQKVEDLVQNYPIREMTPYIAKQDKDVAAYLVAIAKKESNWGKYSPKKEGQECYNYWGYRGQENQTASGYSCFDSPEHAVEVVGGRIKDLIAQNVDTPREMVMWKCGPQCNGPAAQGAGKWVQDVNLYYKKFYQ